MNTKQKQALATVIEYLKADEQKNYEETPLNSRQNHIYNSVKILEELV